MDFGLAVLVALGIYRIGSIILTIPIYFCLSILLLVILRKRKQKAINDSKKNISNSKILLKSLLISLIAAIVFPLPRLSDIQYRFQVAKYQLGDVPTTYSYAKISNVSGDATSEKASITLDLIVLNSGRYSYYAEFPCYNQISMQVYDGKDGTPQVSPSYFISGQPYKIIFSYLLDGKYRNNYYCKNKFFEFRLSPEESNLFGKDRSVIFSGYLGRIKAAGADAENSGIPYVYIKEFNFSPT